MRAVDILNKKWVTKKDLENAKLKIEKRIRNLERNKAKDRNWTDRHETILILAQSRLKRLNEE